MSPFTVLLLVAQACLIQSAFGCGYAPAAPVVAPCAGPATLGLGAAGLGYGVGLGYGTGLGYGGLGALRYGAGLASSYGGEGCGGLSVVGDMTVTGNTRVTGQIPVLGQVGFAGAVPAAGAVTISGSCGYPCGCNSGLYY